MNLSAGTRLGPYEIVAPLGAGGTGEVCRAKGTRLERDVAIKILPADCAQNSAGRSDWDFSLRNVEHGSRVLVNLSIDQGVVEPVALVQNRAEGLGK